MDIERSTLKELTDWEFDIPVFLTYKAEYHPRILQKKTKRGVIENFKKHPYFWAVYRPMKRILVPVDTLRTFDDFLEWRWLTRLCVGLQDGWYALRGFKYQTRRCWGKNMGVRDFRWVFVFRVENGILVAKDIIRKAKGKPSGRAWLYKSKKNRPAKYFAIIKFYLLKKHFLESASK